MEQFQGPGACLVVERIIREGTDDASQEKGQSCLFVLERYRERSSRSSMYLNLSSIGTWSAESLLALRKQSCPIFDP